MQLDCRDCVRVDMDQGRTTSSGKESRIAGLFVREVRAVLGKRASYRRRLWRPRFKRRADCPIAAALPY